MGRSPCAWLAAAASPAAAFLLASQARAAGTFAANAARELDLAEWLQDLAFDLPPFRWGPLLSVEGGNCTGLRARRVEADDVGGPRSFEVVYRVSGLSVRCQTSALSGTLIVRYELEESSAEFKVAVEPRALELPGGSLTLPLGQVTVSQCSVSFRLRRLSFEGPSILAPGLELSHQNLRRAFQRDGPAFLCEDFKGRIARKATQVLQDATASLTLRANALADLPPAPALSPTAPLVDWSEYPPLRLARAVLVERADVLARLARHRGALVVPVNRDWDLGSSSRTVSLHVESVELDGLSTLSPQRLSLRGEGSRVDLSLAYESLRIGVRSAIGVDMPGAPPLHKELNFTLSLRNASLALQALAMVSRPALEGLSVEQLQRPGCLAGCAGSAVPPEHSPLGLLDLALAAAPGLRLAAAGTLEAELAALGDATAAAAIRGYPPDFQSLLHTGIGLARPYLDAAVRGYLGGAPPCEPAVGRLGPGDAVARAMPWIFAALSAASLMGWTLALPNSMKAARLGGELIPVEDPICDDLAGCGAEPGSLSSRAAVPRAASMYFPLLIFATMALFAYADLCLGTVIDVVMTAGERTMTVGPAFAFSLVSCVVDAWGAGAYGIAALVGLLSGVWPFAKLGLLLFAWWAPPRQLSTAARGRMLRILDSLGKYSLVDSWLAILALASYRMKWHSKTEAASLLVDPVPMPPFFAFVLAAVLSLLLGHVASECHRRAAAAEEASARGLRSVTAAEPAQALPRQWKPAPASPRRRLLRREARPGEQHWLTLGLVLTAGAIFVGACVTSFQMDMSGAMAELLLDPADAKQRYSLVSLGAGVTLGKPGDWGMRMVQIVFFLFTLVIPLATIGFILFLWHAPLDHSTQEALLHFCQALDAWASFDVFVLAVAVSHFEFGLVATFLVYYDNLSTLCGWVRDHLHTECFHIECSLTLGFVLLAAAGALSHAVPKAALRLCESALDGDEDELSDGELPVS
uniref:Uncharacterized protein n=1 Tax=Alexandrium monilatum TaxID=311494 RepID=A0A7S4Q2R5_9DINO